MFKTIEKASVPVQIVNYFLDSISSNELKNKERLPAERTLCELMGVGRSTLREALRILEMMGVIEKKVDGTYVHIQEEAIIRDAVALDFAVGITNYAELVEIRNFMGVETIVLAAQNRSEDDLEKLRGLCDKMHTSLNDIEQYANSSTEFHISIARATHNSILAEIFEAMRYVMYDYQKNNMRTLGEVLRSYHEHLELLKALERGDAAECEQLMRVHLDYTQNLYERDSTV